MQEFGFVTLASFRLCVCVLCLLSLAPKRVAASWLSMMWTVDDLCVLETPNIASCFCRCFSNNYRVGGLLGHRIKLTCGCDDFLTGGWRSVGTVVFCVCTSWRHQTLLRLFCYCFTGFFFGLRGLMSHRVALSCWCGELLTATWL